MDLDSILKPAEASEDVEPEFYQLHHGFPQTARKVLPDISFIRHAFQANPAACTQALSAFLGEGAQLVVTKCLIEDIRNIIGDAALFPYSEVLSCQHGLDYVRAIDCIRSVVGEYNGDKLVVATRENGGLADQVRGLPLVAIAADEQITYLMPSNAQMEYVADHGPEVANQMNEEKRQFKQRRENLRQRAINKGIR